MSGSLRRFFLFVLLFTAYGQANALGIGELVLRSGLGQPFLATVHITDTPTDRVEAGCIFLDHGLPGAKFFLVRAEGGHEVRIFTGYGVTNPVVSFTLGFHCSELGTVEKSFVTLLDPGNGPPPPPKKAAPLAQPSKKLAKKTAEARKVRHLEARNPPLRLKPATEMPAFPRP